MSLSTSPEPQPGQPHTGRSDRRERLQRRDYICAMANELALMARQSDDVPLALLLEAAADRAAARP